MRQIKFRAWDKEKKEWSSFIVGQVDYSTMITTLNVPENNNLIIQQYTGIKDMNGKEIYEGDIVSFSENDFTWVIEWDYLELMQLPGMSFHKNFSWVEVIGNINENPELLENHE